MSVVYRKSTGQFPFFILLILFQVFLIVGYSAAQTEEKEFKFWTIKTSFVLSGSSDNSDPDGYKVYSALSVEPAVVRRLSKTLAIELSVRTESHEVDAIDFSGANIYVPLGSIELLPVNFLLIYHIPITSSIHPYAGAGLNSTFCWEKSGWLNSTDLTPSFGPAIHLGMDVNLSSNMFFNFNLGWNKLQTEIEDWGFENVTLNIDPLSLKLGVGFNF